MRAWGLWSRTRWIGLSAPPTREPEVSSEPVHGMDDRTPTKFECLANAALCDQHGQTTADPVRREQFENLARRWRELARKIEALEN